MFCLYWILITDVCPTLQIRRLRSREQVGLRGVLLGKDGTRERQGFLTPKLLPLTQGLSQAATHSAQLRWEESDETQTKSWTSAPALQTEIQRGSSVIPLQGDVGHWTKIERGIKWYCSHNTQQPRRWLEGDMTVTYKTEKPRTLVRKSLSNFADQVYAEKLKNKVPWDKPEFFS